LFCRFNCVPQQAFFYDEFSIFFSKPSAQVDILPYDSKTISSSYYYLRLRPDNRNESFFMFSFFFSLSHSENNRMVDVVVGGARRTRIKKKCFYFTCAGFSLFLFPFFSTTIFQREEGKSHTTSAVNIK
jgi:hypothetical protein